MYIREMPILVPIPISSNPASWYNSMRDWKKNHRRFLLKENWYFTIPATKKYPEIKIMIPKGFIFDGASVPRFLWPILNPFGILMIAGLIHDFGYRYNFFLDQEENIICVEHGQKFFDDIFFVVARKTNGTIILNQIAYRSLRIFGFIAWGNGRKKNSHVYWQNDTRSPEEIWDEMMNSIHAETYLISGCPRKVFLKRKGIEI